LHVLLLEVDARLQFGAAHGCLPPWFGPVGSCLCYRR
jgi:hypothetical protein